MKNRLILAPLLFLLMSVILFLRPDPWDAARDYATGYASEFMTMVPQHDLIGIRVAEHSALVQLALWDRSGALLYPLPDDFSPLKNELDTGDLADVIAVQTGTTVATWTEFDREGQQVLYCQHDPAACLVFDRAALAAALGVPTLGSMNTAGRLQLAAGLCLLAGVLLILSLWRRHQQSQAPKDFELLPEQFCARRDGHNIPLTKRDTKILALLQARAGTVVTRDELYDAGWGRDFMPNSRALDQHIINLRKKLDPDKTRPELIETVRGIGYRFVI